MPTAHFYFILLTLAVSEGYIATLPSSKAHTRANAVSRRTEQWYPARNPKHLDTGPWCCNLMGLAMVNGPDLVARVVLDSML